MAHQFKKIAFSTDRDGLITVYLYFSGDSTSSDLSVTVEKGNVTFVGEIAQQKYEFAMKGITVEKKGQVKRADHYEVFLMCLD